MHPFRTAIEARDVDAVVGLLSDDVLLRSPAGTEADHVRSSKLGIGDILVSIAHCRTYATAYALALGRPASSRQSATPAHQS